MVLEYKIHTAAKHLKIHPSTPKSVVPEKPHWKIVSIPSCGTNKAPRNSSEYRCDSGSKQDLPTPFLLQFLPFWHGINFQSTYSGWQFHWSTYNSTQLFTPEHSTPCPKCLDRYGLSTPPHSLNIQWLLFFFSSNLFTTNRPIHPSSLIHPYTIHPLKWLLPIL